MDEKLSNILINSSQIKDLSSINIEEDGLTLTYSFETFSKFKISVVGWNKLYIQEQIDKEQHELEEYIKEAQSFRAHIFFRASNFDLNSMFCDFEHEKDVYAGIDLSKLIIIPFYQYHLNKLT